MDWIGMWSENAQSFALVLTGMTFFGFSLPIFLIPARWAKLLGWRLPEDTDLAWYFARCLGSFAVVTNLFLLKAGIDGTGIRLMYEFFSVFCALMILVHVWGAIERSQPKIETLEIGFWAGLGALMLMFMPL